MMHKYKFVKYNKKYQKLFQKERDKLMKIISKAKIEHFGSTAVNNLGGKGIIDILISVPKSKMELAKISLINSKYIFRKEWSKDRFSFYRKYGFLYKRIVHIHLTFNGSKVEKQAIKFRNVLKKVEN